MYYRLKYDINRYGWGLNSFIYDDSDESIEFLTENEYESVTKEVGVGDRYFEGDENLLAKAVLMYNNRVELFNNGFISVYLSYEAEYKKWSIYTEPLHPRIPEIEPSMSESAGTLFRWEYRGSKVRADVPKFYACYLIQDVSGRNREIKKILSLTRFNWIDANYCRHVNKGLGFIKKLSKIC